MKTILRCLLLPALLLAACACSAQTIAPASLLYQWASPSGTGQLGQYLVFTNSNQPRPGNYSITWSVSGTAPSACTFRVEGSADGVSWFGLDVTAPAATSCTSSNMESIANKPVNYLRINLASWTPGDGTTRVVFYFTGGRS